MPKSLVLRGKLFCRWCRRSGITTFKWPNKFPWLYVSLYLLFSPGILIKHELIPLFSQDGVPDQTFSILRGDKCEALALVEFKSIGVVNGMVSVIGKPSNHPNIYPPSNDPTENAEQGIKTDTTDDWKAVTRQLRMYAASSNIQDVIVMDECVGIYFCFPEAPNESGHHHDFLYASTKLSPDFGINPRLSLRELVVFAILSSLDRKNIELRDFAADASPITVGANTRPYRNVLPGIAPAPSSKKRQGSSFTHSRREGSKRGKQSDPVPHDRFDRFILQLELLPDMAPVATRGRISSRDSGFYDATDRTPPKKSTPGIRPVAAPFITLQVERILKDTVALVTDGASHFIAKLFPTHSDKDSERRLAAELAVYTECATLQGTFIPYLQGVYRFHDASPPNSSLVLLTEYIGDGTTIASIFEELYNIPDETAADDVAFENGIKRLAELHDRAKTTLDALHRRKVVHADVVGRNIVVDENDNVVLVDFGYSLVLRDNLARFRVRRDDDLAQLRNAFAVEE